MRRLRRTGVLRGLTRETELTAAHLIQPLFVKAGTDVREDIDSMPGVQRLSISELVEEAGAVRAAGVDSVLLFGIPADKDEMGSGAFDDEGIVQMAIRALKEADPELTVIADTCMCEYTSHGHCGMGPRGRGGRQRPLDRAARQDGALAGRRRRRRRRALGHDGRPDRRDPRALDAAGFSETPIIAYSAKYASAFYGPFREAADSTPQFGDRRAYQMDPANVLRGDARVAARPRRGRRHRDGQARAGLPRHHRAGSRTATGAPLAAYHVSGEYAMLKAGGRCGWLDERAAVLEALTSIRRAGADVIITYYAKDAASWLNG